jgi:hypothetical protein
MLVGLLFSHMVQYSKENIVRLKVYLDRPYVTKFETDQVCTVCTRTSIIHCNENPIYVFPEKELYMWPQSQVPHTCVCEAYCALMG